MMDVDAEVKRCVQMMTHGPHAEIHELVRALVAGGITEIEAEALIALVPIGFAHAALDGTGVELPSDFLIRNPDTVEPVRASFAEDPVFQSATRLARNMLATESSRRDALKIVARSAEWATLRQLCPEGNDFSGCGLVEPVLMRVPIEYLQTVKRIRSRWRFWTRG